MKQIFITFFIMFCTSPTMRAQTVVDYQAAAENGDAKAQYILGDCYWGGNGGATRDDEKAAYWFAKSAEQSLKEAQWSLGLCYYFGVGVIQDFQKAVYWFTKSAEQGFKYGQAKLGDCYSQGEGVPQNYEKAEYWYTKSAEQDLEGISQVILGKRFYKGDGLPQNYEKAEYWFTKGAEQGSEGSLLLGNYYYKGDNLPQNYKKAVYWFTKSAEQGSETAQLRLGGYYSTIEDYTQATYWFKKATELGSKDAKLPLGICYFFAQDYTQAVHWFTKVTEQNSKEAQWFLGLCYFEGKGISQDYTQATYWFSKAAEQGLKEAQNSLGVCYTFGLGVTQDFTQALYWLNKALEQGMKETQLSLGLYYFEMQDYMQAVYWLSKATEYDSKEAQAYLGCCYHYGYGVKQDYAQAMYWYNLSAEQGLEVAKQGLKECHQDSIREEKLLVLFDKIQTAFDKNSDSQATITLINEYLSLASENDENKGELLNTLGLFYVNAENTGFLLTTINSLKNYDAHMPHSEWQEEIRTLEQEYAKLAAKYSSFSENIIGYWVSDRYNTEGTPYLIISILQDRNNQFVTSSLSIKNESHYFSNFNNNEKNWLRTSQSFYLNGEERSLRSVSGTEKLKIGNDFGAMMMTTFINELGNNLKDYIRATNNNFIRSTMKETGVNIVASILGSLIQEASVSKKVVKVCTLNLRQDANDNKQLTGKLQKTIYTMRSDMDAIYSENEDTNVKFVKAGWNDKIIFATSNGEPIYIGGSTENDYKNSELWNINQRYKRNNKEKKEAIKEYNKQVYKRLGLIIN